jgi:putative lipoic acid-binding regulatory protein
MADARTPTVTVRLVFADEGTFHAEMIHVAAEKLEQHERLIDLLREEPSVTRQIYMDMSRLVSAYVVGDDV